MNTTTNREVSADDIELAFEQNLFSVVYQPQVSLADRTRVVGAEAFVRMLHPDFGEIAPPVFLPAVRDAGKMLELTTRVLSVVSKDWLEWHVKGVDLSVSVNIEDSVLSEADLAKQLGKILDDQNIPKQRLTLELSQYLDANQLPDKVGAQLLGLRMKGYRLSLDGFGLSQTLEQTVADLTLDELKIDRQIINTLLAQEASQATVRAALHLASRYSMRVVAVGIETEAEMEWLARNGCDCGQGYLFGKPMTAGDFSKEFLENDSLPIHTEERTAILVLEDDPQYQTLLQESLSDHYDIQVAGSIAQAEALLPDSVASILISDVNLPDGSGIDFCRDRAAALSEKEISTLFISGARDFKNKLEAYEAGGIDFIEKPFSIVELIAKIKQISIYQNRRKSLAQESVAANEMALQSMKDAAYYGDIVQFFKNLLHCRDEEQLARELFRFMGDRDLLTCVEFRSAASLSTFDQLNTVCSPIELNILELLRDKGRLYEFGRRMIVNDERISILIKNMPVDEIEQGKIRDYAAVIIEGMEARYRDILRQRIINTVMQQLEQLAQTLITTASANAKRKAEILEKYSFDLQMSFHVLDLTEEQEQHLNTIIQSMLDTREEEQKNTEAISEEVNSILSSMTAALDDLEVNQEQDEEPDIGDSVELF